MGSEWYITPADLSSEGIARMMFFLAVLLIGMLSPVVIQRFSLPAVASHSRDVSMPIWGYPSGFA